MDMAASGSGRWPDADLMQMPMPVAIAAWARGAGRPAAGRWARAQLEGAATTKHKTAAKCTFLRPSLILVLSTTTTKQIS